MNFEKNGEYIAKATAFGVNGEGIVKLDGMTVFLPFVLPTEKVKFKVVKLKKNYAYGKVLEVYTPADERVRPDCPVFTKCGGCQLQHLKYSNQLKFKTKAVADCLKKIAFIDYEVPLALKSDKIYGYRNKLQLPVGVQGGRNAIGFFAENSHRIVEICGCKVNPPWSEDIISCFKAYMRETNIKGYDEETGEGLLRHIVVREIYGKFIIVAVINGENLPNMDRLITVLSEKFKKFSFFLNINKKRNNTVTTDEFKHIFGDGRYECEEYGVKYEVGPGTFMQINESVRNKIYDRVVKLAESDRETIVIDAYSGAGLLTAMLAQDAKRAFGIEIVKEAADCADILAEKNHIKYKMSTVLGDCAAELPKLLKENADYKTVVVLDPPRKGCGKEVIASILEHQPDKIIYISCNPATLSRDLGLLLDTLVYDNGELKRNEEPKPAYEINHLQPYDMFPQTKHVETVVCLIKPGLQTNTQKSFEEVNTDEGTV